MTETNGGQGHHPFTPGQVVATLNGRLWEIVREVPRKQPRHTAVGGPNYELRDALTGKLSQSPEPWEYLTSGTAEEIARLAELRAEAAKAKEATE